MDLKLIQMKTSCKRKFLFWRDTGSTHTFTYIKGGSINSFKTEAFTITPYTKYFNKLHLNAGNQSKTSQMLDLGRVHVHTWLGRRQGDTCVPSAFQIYFSFKEKPLINKTELLSNMFFSVGFYLWFPQDRKYTETQIAKYKNQNALIPPALLPCGAPVRRQSRCVLSVLWEGRAGASSLSLHLHPSLPCLSAAWRAGWGSCACAGHHDPHNCCEGFPVPVGLSKPSTCLAAVLWRHFCWRGRFWESGQCWGLLTGVR